MVWPSVTVLTGGLAAGALAFAAWSYSSDLRHQAAAAKDLTQRLAASHARMIADQADDALEHQGPAKALLMAMHALGDEAGIPYDPKAEYVAYLALEQLRNSAVRSGYRSVSYAKDGALLLMSENRKLYILKGDHFEPPIDLPPDRVGDLWSAYIDPSGTKILVNGSSEIPLLLNRNGSTPLPLSINKQQTAGIGSFSADARYIVTSSFGSSSIGIWNTASGQFVNSVPGRAGTITKDGKLVVYDNNAKVLKLYKISGSDLRPEPDQPLKEASSVFFIQANPVYPNLVFFTTADGGEVLWDLRAKQPITKFTPNIRIESGVFSQDGHLIAVESTDQAIRVYDVTQSNVLIAVMKGQFGRWWSMSFDPGSKVLASATKDPAETYFWNLDSLIQTSGDNYKDLQEQINHSDNGPLSCSGAERSTASATNHWDDKVSLSLPPGFIPEQIEPYEKWDGTSDWVLLPLESGRLLLYDLRYPNWPIAALDAPRERPCQVRWHSVDFTDDPARIVATTAWSAQYTWRYFSSPEDLQTFAHQKLPQIIDESGKSTVMQLSHADECRLELLPEQQCNSQ